MNFSFLRKFWSNFSSIFFKLIPIILIIYVGYFILNFGHFFEIYKKSIADSEPLVRITIMVVSSFVTFLAMVVALFKEDIRGFFVKPKLELSENNGLKEVLKKVRENSREADFYHYSVIIKNIGNIPAKEVEVHLTTLKYKKNNEHTYNELEVDGVPLEWRNSESSQITIPRNSKKSLVLLKLLPASQDSTPDEQQISNQPEIEIGTSKYSVDADTTEWIITFAIYSDNAKPLSIDLEVKWNGKWETRLTEMASQCSVVER